MVNREDRFPLDVRLAAQHSERACGVLACVTLAQWALESNFGKSMPLNSNNPFGIKARGSQPFVASSTKEWDRAKLRFYTTVCKFAKYENIEEAFLEHGRLLTRPTGPYKESLKYRKDLMQYLARMGKVYATDPQYAFKLLKIINLYSLQDYNLAD